MANRRVEQEMRGAENTKQRRAGARLPRGLSRVVG